MFKLTIFTCLVALVAAKPSGLEQIHLVEQAPVLKTALISEPAHIAIHERVLAKVGEQVESVPTAVSHQSSTVVHSRANLVTPLVAPVVKTHLAPAFRTYAASYLEPQPIIKTYGAAPILKSYGAPIAYTYSAGAPLLLPSAYGYGLPAYRSW